MVSKFLQWVVNKLERRVSASKLVKAEDLVLSNASLEDIRRGIRKITAEVGIVIDEKEKKDMPKLVIITKCIKARPQVRWYEDRIHEVFSVVKQVGINYIVYDAKYNMERIILKEETEPYPVPSLQQE